MTKHTIQETFDTVARHLLRQSAKSVFNYVYGETSCAYRGDNGLRCAAGCLIPDSEYSKSIEGSTVYPVMDKLGRTDFFGHDRFLVRRLQVCHDSKPVSLWKDNMRSLANKLELDPSVLDEFEWDEKTRRYVENVK